MQAQAGQADIELDGLSMRFGRKQILHELNAKLTGHSFGLLGPNGAGKTTLLHTLLGFHPATAGTARLFGYDIRNQMRDIHALVGYMPENDSFIAGMSAVRMTMMMAELSGLPPREALERSHEALYYVGLDEARYRPIETYSLGMKQMAKLAQAIVHGPRLLFLDEPTNGLDPPHRARMIRLVREIRDSGSVHIVLSSHLLRDVEECCDQVLILKDGRVAQSCDLEEERKANMKFIMVETSDDEQAELFGAEIAGLGCEYANLGKGRLKMVLPQGVGIRDLYTIAAAKEIQIRRLDYKKDSLQEIFLRAMGANHGGL